MADKTTIASTTTDMVVTKTTLGLFERVLGGLILSGVVAAVVMPRDQAVKNAIIETGLANVNSSLNELKALVTDHNNTAGNKVSDIEKRVNQLEKQLAVLESNKKS